ncbi:MND1-interacting protein 1-like [Rhodamnia argentea]|uniref:MND1-interacting protein 1-like n=1 Tax=Rhodamnia argentea TaxID=178133 RepID=A0A8B8PFN3_9MYRT|nr:MND1-interacting protein 1-like [Rhodamnia argentea]
MGKSARNKQKSKNRRQQSQNPQPKTRDQPGQAPSSITGTGPSSTPQSGCEDGASRIPSSDPNWLPTPSPAIGPLAERFSQEDFKKLPEMQLLEKILLGALEEKYIEALRRLVEMGYDEDAALKAVLRNGHCYGDEDVLLNIFNNALAYLTGDCRSRNLIFEANGILFTSLAQMAEHSLGCMVHVLQQVHHSRRKAMWSLVLSKLHIGLAVAMPPSEGNWESDSSDEDAVDVDLPPCCRFNRCLGIWWLVEESGVPSDMLAVGNERNKHQPNDEEHLQSDIEVPESFGLSPELKSMLKKNVAKVAAAVRANLMQNFMHSNASVKGDAPAVSQPEACGESSVLRCKEWVNSVADTLPGRLSNLNLDGNLVGLPEERKDAIILHLQNQIEDHERQVKEREAWARQKAVQADKSVESALLELETLRKEMAESRHVLKKGKPTLDASTRMKLSDKESALRKMGARAEATHAAMTRVENENAKIKAETEAFNLSASESANACREVAKREKKNQKKLLACEKQKVELQESIAEEKQKITELQQQLVEIQKAQREAETKWRQAADAKELANAQLKEEKRALEAAKADSKKRLEDLRLRTETEMKLYRDKVLRLEQELSDLKIAAGNTEATPMHELDVQDHRKCIICWKNEVRILFLPCAHEVLCADCSDKYGYKEKVLCPMCQVPIEEAIRVFGGSLK